MTGFTEADREKLTEVHTDMKHVKASVKDHEKRIRFNEKFVFGSAAVIGSISLISGLILGIKKIFMT